MENPTKPVRTAIDLFLYPGEVIELRALDVPVGNGFTATIYGYFDDPEKLAAAINALDDKEAKGVYITLNPVNPALKARADNRFVKAKRDASTATDADVEKRQWILVDADPKRPSGISSTDDEKRAAFELVKIIAEELAKRGFPAPVIADSGNGYHLLFRIDLPNTQESTDAIKTLLEGLHHRFGSEKVSIDRSVFNASRITKAYGTMARKGDSTPDRPHRRSALFEVPETLETVSLATIQTVADEFSPPKKTVANDKATADAEAGRSSLEKMKALLDRHQLKVSKEKALPEDGHLLELEVCPFDLDHTRSACVTVSRSGGIGFKCHHNSCSQHDWKALRERLGEPAVCSAPKRKSAILSPDTPYKTARRFLNDEFRALDRPTLHYYAESFYAWDGVSYRPLEDTGIRSRIYKYLDQAKKIVRMEKNRVKIPFNPNKGHVDTVVDGLKSQTHISQEARTPSWEAEDAPPNDVQSLIACPGGIFDLETGRVHPTDPAFFATGALEFTPDPDAPEPQLWLAFLSQLWPDDPESIEILQMIFGYLLSNETRYQKMFYIYGPPRSGKGTIARILGRLLGASNIVAPTLAGLAGNFGLACLIGKKIAIVSDARFASTKEIAVVVERLLCVSGEDPITVARKHRNDVTLKLPTRFLFLSNEYPRFTDASGALANRFILLQVTKSFLGQEDLQLEEKLVPELPGIMNWALEGLRKLLLKGRFPVTQAAREAMEDIEELASPALAFVRECCIQGPEHEAACNDLFEAWLAWCNDQGRDHPGTLQNFCRELVAACPTLRKRKRTGKNGRRENAYQGIRLLRKGECPRLSPAAPIVSPTPNSPDPTIEKAQDIRGQSSDAEGGWGDL